MRINAPQGDSFALLPRCPRIKAELGLCLIAAANASQQFMQCNETVGGELIDLLNCALANEACPLLAGLFRKMTGAV